MAHCIYSVKKDIMTTANTYDNLVQELYVAYFGRPADYFSLQNFDQALSNAGAPTDAAGLVAAYQTNAAVKTLIDAFGTSTESTTLYSGTTNDFVNAVFKDLFNRTANPAGLSFWSHAIDSHQVSMGLAALAILEGAQQNSSAQGLIDQQTIANKVTVAESFTMTLGELTSQIVAYHGPVAAEDARLMLAGVGATTNTANFDVQTTINHFTINGSNAYNLTVAPETLVGGPYNNVFNGILDNAAGLAAGGQAQTLVANDSITGGAQNNTFNITDFGIDGVTTIPGGVTVNGVQTWNISSLEAVSGDFSAWPGLTMLNVKDSTGDDAIVVGGQVSVSAIDTAGNVSVQGGTNVTVTTDSAHTVTVNSSAANFIASVGDSTNSITDIAVDAAVTIAGGAGSNTVTLGPGASGTISFAAHTAVDTIVLAPSEANPAAFVAISGLNNVGSDAITFSGDVNTLIGFTQITAANVTASGGNTSSLISWVQAADGAHGSGVSGAAHTVTWFVFQGNTYLLESVAGQTADDGTLAAGNTLVELTGTGYSFSHATGVNGSLHLLG